MKALVSINFALEIEDEDDLMILVRNIDESMRESIVNRTQSNSEDLNEFIEEAEVGGRIDWYGATVSLKRPVLNYAEGDD